MSHTAGRFAPLTIAVLTVSDTRLRSNDRSGDYLCSAVAEAGHRVGPRQLVPDDVYAIRAAVSTWIADSEISVILATGGTGLRARDVTIEAVGVLLDREIPGFGELFRSVSAREIGSSTIQSRALAGLANDTLVVCLPGSPGACRTAWDHILVEQLDATHHPCNFVELLIHGTGG